MARTERPTSNAQRSTLNQRNIRRWTFDVGCWMFDVQLDLDLRHLPSQAFLQPDAGRNPPAADRAVGDSKQLGDLFFRPAVVELERDNFPLLLGQPGHLLMEPRPQLQFLLWHHGS